MLPEFRYLGRKYANYILLRGLFFEAWGSLMSLKSQTQDPQLEDLCSEILHPEKIHRPQPGLNVRTLDLKASMLPRDWLLWIKYYYYHYYYYYFCYYFVLVLWCGLRLECFGHGTWCWPAPQWAKDFWTIYGDSVAGLVDRCGSPGSSQPQIYMGINAHPLWWEIYSSNFSFESKQWIYWTYIPPIMADDQPFSSSSDSW